MEGLEYNTAREKMRMPEYGRSILKMIEHLREIPDKAKRSEQAQAVIKSMEILNPQVRSQEDFRHKLWDHLFIIAGFDLDIDAPYPCPVKEEFDTRPVPLPMKDDKIKAAHYGRNIEKMLNLLCDEPDSEIKTAMIKSLATYMRQQYLIWNKDSVSDETIFADMEKMSEYRLRIPEGLVLNKISFDANYSRPGQGQNGQGRGRQGKRSFKQRKRQ